MKTSRSTLLVAVLLIGCLVTAVSAHAGPWQDADIGSPKAAGSHVYEGIGALSVTGAGKGDSQQGDDQLHYTYLTRAGGGDIDVIARVDRFDGKPHGRAGIMLRTTNDPKTSVTADIALSFQDDPSGRHALFCTAHDKNVSYGGASNGVTTSMSLPIWLRLVRIGKSFAVYKSPDGSKWSILGDTSGWQFAASGPYELGFFASSGESGTTSTADFDHIRIGRPSLGYESSWYGNPFGGRVYDGHVSNWVSSMWTAPDGSCYTNSAWDEGGEAVKIYKDGKSIKAFRTGNELIGNSACGEGTITSDGSHVYLVSSGYEGCMLLKTDMFGTAASTVPLYLSLDTFDHTKNINVVSGLAAENGELYIGDSRDNVIRVAKTNIPIYYQVGNSTVNFSPKAIDTTGVPNAAPPSVYMYQRECDFLPYRIPGLDPKAVYTVRCHFAEYKEQTAGRRLIDITVSGAPNVTGFDVVKAAGGSFKPAVLDIPGGRTDPSGNLDVTFVRSSGGDGHIVVNGIEVLNADGSQVFALSCGGPSNGTFKGETYDLPDRTFPFNRPGPMTVDRRGDLWIIREANDFPVGTTPTTKYLGAVACYHPNGTPTGQTIEDVNNPTALAYDSTRDRLLVTDNGPNQNVRIYGNLASSPKFAGAFGVKGGLYSGRTPGLIYDPKSGGYARFYGLVGVGIDGQGNVYVACNSQGTDIRKFTPGGDLVWMLATLPFCCTPDFDPDSDGKQVYGVYCHASMDYSRAVPGSEWKYVAYNWNPSLYGPPPRQGAAQSIVRRIGPKRALFQFTSGQGTVDYIGIFRYDNEVAIPCGQIRNDGAEIWTDADGDGKETGDEVAKGSAAGGLCSFSVDKKGDLWLSCIAQTPVLRHFICKGINASGAPIYDFKPGDYEDIPFPSIGKAVNTWGQKAEAKYDSVRDVMYLMGPAKDRIKDQNNVVSYIARYDRWSKGNRVATWITTLPDPATDVNFAYDSGNPGGLAHHWMGMDVATDRIFIASLWGQIYEYDAAYGRFVRILNPGPEIDGFVAWEDARQGLTATKLSTGEYVVLSENSGYDGKCNMYRIPASSEK
jgi:sugar lactone lactonase YvrE